MTQLYTVEGMLNKGFVGQITYMVCLDEPLKELDIEFSFDKQKYEPSDVTQEMVTDMQHVFLEKYQSNISPEEMKKCILQDMKTEIHTLATLNDEFIGCIHRQMTTRHMKFCGEEATEGCIPHNEFSGVLKVTVLVFNVIKDQTNYRLTVCGTEKGVDPPC